MPRQFIVVILRCPIGILFKRFPRMGETLIAVPVYCRRRVFCSRILRRLPFSGLITLRLSGIRVIPSDNPLKRIVKPVAERDRIVKLHAGRQKHLRLVRYPCAAFLLIEIAALEKPRAIDHLKQVRFAPRMRSVRRRRLDPDALHALQHVGIGAADAEGKHLHLVRQHLDRLLSLLRRRIVVLKIHIDIIHLVQRLRLDRFIEMVV